MISLTLLQKFTPQFQNPGSALIDVCMFGVTKCVWSFHRPTQFNLEFVDIAPKTLTQKDVNDPNYKRGRTRDTFALSARSRPRRKITPEKKNDCGCVLSFRCQVTPAVNEDTSVLIELTVGNSSQFNQLVQSGDVRAATQLANAVLQTANQLNSTTTQDKIEVRNNIISKHS